MNTHFRDDKGFTLVELAVVMVIIGLLIGGILKGQEMIANARVNATISQVKAVDAASSTFQDMYDAVAGDMVDANTRLPGGQVNGDGNTVIDSNPFAVAGPLIEAQRFFEHLGAADLMSSNMANQGISAEISGSEITVGQLATSGALGLHTNARAGRYAVIARTAAPGTVSLSQLQAGRIDRKLDDGDATTGSVFANGTAGAAAANCANAGVYNEMFESVACSLAIRIN